jgi:hypothetical protein
MRAVAIAAMLLPMTLWSIEISLASDQSRRTRFEAEHGLSAPARTWISDKSNYALMFTGELPDQCNTLAVADYNDQWAKLYIRKAQANGFQLLAHHRGALQAARDQHAAHLT